MVRLTIVILLILVPATSFADNRQVIKQEKELEDVNKQIRDTKITIEKIKKKEISILDEVERVNRKVTEKRKKTRSIAKSIKKVEAKLASADKKIKTLEVKRDALRANLDIRLRAIYKMRSGNILKVIFSSLSSEDLGKRYKYMSMVMASDRELMKEYENSLFKLEDVRDRYDSLKAELEADKKKLDRSAYAAKLELKGKKRLLSGVKKEKKNHLAMVSELEDAAKDLKNLLKSLKDGDFTDIPTKGFIKTKGTLKMPVNGRIVSRYGKVRHPEFKTVTFNNGIVISSPFGTAIRNVYNGKVAFVGWLKGYGQMMIVDHGEGFYTLYGHLFKVLKSKGDYVYKGDELALVGESGTYEEPGLYFEIRQKGAPRDPATWLSRK